MGTKIDYSNITKQPKAELRSIRKVLHSKEYYVAESEKELKKALKDPLNHFMHITNHGVYAINKLHYKKEIFPLLEGNPVTYYFSLAYDVLPQITEARMFLLDSLKGTQSEFRWKSSTAFSYIFKVGALGTIFSFLALESFMNQCLPDYAKIKYKGKLVDKLTIQRRLTFEDKFKIIIPTVTGKDFIAEHPRKTQIIIDLKMLRDELTHLKENRKNGFSAYEDLNNRILSLDLKKIVNTVKFYINYHQPRTIQNYREKKGRIKLKIVSQERGEDERGTFIKQYYIEEQEGDIIGTRF